MKTYSLRIKIEDNVPEVLHFTGSVPDGTFVIESAEFTDDEGIHSHLNITREDTSGNPVVRAGFFPDDADEPQASGHAHRPPASGGHVAYDEAAHVHPHTH